MIAWRLHYSLLPSKKSVYADLVNSEKVKNPHTCVYGFFGRRTWNRHVRLRLSARVCLTAIRRHFECSALKNANVATAHFVRRDFSLPTFSAKQKGYAMRTLFVWQGQKDLNPRPLVLETSTLPTELYPCVVSFFTTLILYHNLK